LNSVHSNTALATDSSLPNDLPSSDAPSFESIGLVAPLVRALHAEGYTQPTPIQTQAIPYVLQGRDLVGCAQTGTGKTAAFALPILQRLAATPAPRARVIRALVLSPTRELAQQIAASFAAYGRHTGLRHAVVCGGVGQRGQVDAIRRGLDILVATPGRLCDLIQQRLVSLAQIEVLVLDEADRMLDMGFLPDVKRILATLPRQRQTLLLSATMPPDIEALAQQILQRPVRVNVATVAKPADAIDQLVFFVSMPEKRRLLVQLMGDRAISRAIVFTRTKHGASRLCEHLMRASIQAEAIHGNKSQAARERALSRFKDGSLRVLVATDIAARGIDVDGISHVVNYDLPNIAETYVHRIGRTARAGASGTALSFCSPEERPHLMAIERLIKRRVPVAETVALAPAAAANSGGTAPRHAATAQVTIVRSAPTPERNDELEARRPRPGYGRGPRRRGRF
jgi:ATP-dependent RNA helicase RhlE